MHARTQSRPPPSSAAGVLFFEDFDVRPMLAVPAPLDPAPMFTEADLADARAASRVEGHREGLAQARGEQSEGVRQTLAVIAASLADAAASARHSADEQAGAVARLLLATLGALLPRLCARFGAAEAAAVVQALQPALRHEPAVAIRVNPHTREALSAALDGLEPELLARVRFVETDSVASGDVRVEWQDGAAVRDGTALWRAVAGVLAPLDLLDPTAGELATTGATADAR